MFSIGGTALLIMSIWQYISKNPIEAFKSSLLIFTVVTAHIQIGYMIRIDTFSITIPDALLIFNGVMAIILIVAQRGTVRVSVAELFFILIIFLSMVALAVRPYSEELVPLGVSWTAVVSGIESGRVPNIDSASFIYLIRLALFLAILRLIILCKDRIIFLEFIEKFVIYSAPFIFLYSLEFLLKGAFGTNIILDIGNVIFGKLGAQLDFLLERGGLLALQGLTLEPNFLTQSIFIFSLACLVSKPSEIWIRAAFALVYPLLLFSGSLQAVLVASALFAFILIWTKIDRSMIVLTFFVTFFIMLGSSQVSDGFAQYFLYRTSIITQIISDYDNLKYELIFNSEVVRIVSIVENIKLSMYNGLLGVGLGSTYAYGFVPSALSNIGIVGFLAWLWVMHWFFNKVGYRVILLRAVLMLLAFLFIGNLHLLYYPVNLILGIALTKPVRKQVFTPNELSKEL